MSAGEGFIVPLADEEKVAELAKALCQHLVSPLVVYLEGDLGAGKTTFARALIQALGYPGRVKSPTYGLLETYRAGGFTVLHLDLYRLEEPGELEYLGLRDLFEKESIFLVEWPGKGGAFLPGADLVMGFGESDSQRFVNLSPRTPEGQALIDRLR